MIKKVNLKEYIENDKLKKLGGGVASLFEPLMELFGIGPNGAGMADQNRLQRASMKSEENSSIDQLNQQYQLNICINVNINVNLNVYKKKELIIINKNNKKRLFILFIDKFYL